jgi:hypothetical protein
MARLHATVVTCCWALASALTSHAQTTAETEFPQGWRFPLEFHQGPVPRTGSYAGWLSMSALHSVVPGHLRAGGALAPGLFGNVFTGLAGLRVAWRIKSFNTDFGSWGNLQLQAEHWWSTEGTALAGGGPVLEAGERVLAGLKAYLPYGPESEGHPVWLQGSIGLNLFLPKPAPESNDPFSDP